MNVIRSEDGVVYRVLEAPDASAMVDLLAEAFSRAEPMAVAVGLSYQELAHLVAAFMPKAVSEQLSVVACDHSTQQLLGALLADDFGTPPPSGVDHVAPGFAPVGALLERLDEQYRALNLVVPGSHVHIYMVGVAQAAASRGVARNLVEACTTNAARLGFRTAVTEATGGASQHVFRRLGFTEVLAAAYREFLFNGVPVFSSIQGVEGTLLMARTLREEAPPQRLGGAV